jgi:hypothetical protein
MTNILLLGGTDADNGDYSLLAKVAQSSTRTLERWSTLKTAKAGDRVWFYIPSPQSAVVAAGVALGDAVPDDNWPYVMPVGELEWLPRSVPLQELREKFPSWTWAKKARGRTNLPDDVAEYLARGVVSAEPELIGAELDVEPELEQQIAEAEAILVRGLPNVRDRSLVLKRLLDSATMADTTAPNAWGVTLFPDGFRLNVGQVEALVLGEQTLRVNLLTDLSVPPAVGPCFAATAYQSMPEPQCAFVGTVQQYAGVEVAIAAAHESFVRRAASTRFGEARAGTPFRRRHEGLLKLARRTLGLAEDGAATRNDYVAYHSVAVMGYPFVPSENGRVTFLTTKSEGVVRRVLGNTVWVISGERTAGKTRYQLHSKFRPDELAQGQDAWKISGPGASLPAPIDVSDEPWLRELLGEQANFSLGLNRIRSLSVLSALDSMFGKALGFPKERLPEEVPEGTYREGQGVQITVNRYERDASARAACLRHFGPVCQICRVDLATLYGPIAAGLVHVHHLQPLSQVEEQHEVRPDQDLIPVCPNCHAVVHRRDPPVTPDELREMMAQAGASRA